MISTVYKISDISHYRAVAQSGAASPRRSRPEYKGREEGIYEADIEDVYRVARSLESYCVRIFPARYHDAYRTAFASYCHVLAAATMEVH